MKVREAAEEYLAAKRREMKPKTQAEARRILGDFSAFCEGRGVELQDVRARTIDDYLDHIKETRRSKRGGAISTHTLFLHATILKAFLNWCASDEEFETYVRPGTVGKIKKPRRDTFVVETFTKSQVEAILRATTATDVGSEELNAYLRDRDRVIVMLLLDTGIRAAELCGLQMKHLSLSPTDPHIRVFGKGDKWREVGLGERCRKELRRFVHKHVGEDPDGLVFKTRRGGPLEEQVLFRLIQRLGRVAGIEGVRCSPHTFRHTFAVTFMRASGDIYRLSKLMGHTSVHITENYLKSFNQADARRGAVSPLDAAF